MYYYSLEITYNYKGKSNFAKVEIYENHKLTTDRIYSEELRSSIISNMIKDIGYFYKGTFYTLPFYGFDETDLKINYEVYFGEYSKMEEFYFSLVYSFKGERNHDKAISVGIKFYNIINDLILNNLRKLKQSNKLNKTNIRVKTELDEKIIKDYFKEKTKTQLIFLLKEVSEVFNQIYKKVTE